MKLWPEDMPEDLKDFADAIMFVLLVAAAVSFGVWLLG